ncbi:helix-turn-helix domain-containing protein [Dellaglioa sp. L3N]
MEDFLDGQEKISNQILELLQTHGGYLSKKKLTESLQISGNSLRIYLKNIEVRLEKFIESGHVFFEVGANHVKFGVDGTTNLSNIGNDLLRHSYKYKIIMYLYMNETLNLIELENELHISGSSITRRIKELNETLAEFDLKIRNRRLVGTKLQLNYFYYLFFIRVAPFTNREELLSKSATVNEYVEVLNKQYDLEWSDDEKFSVYLWLKILIRLNSYKEQQEEKLTSASRELIKNNPAYAKVKISFFRFLKKYALSFVEEDAVGLYYFLIGFDLIKNDSELYVQIKDDDIDKETPINAAINLFWSDIEENTYFKNDSKINYNLFNLYSKLAIFKGESFIYNRTITEFNRKSLEREDFTQIVQKLLTAYQSVTQFDGLNSQDDLYYLQNQYLYILNILNFEFDDVLKIGLLINRDPIMEKLTMIIMERVLHSVLNVQVEIFQEDKDYDLILTNRMGMSQEQFKSPLYVMSEIGVSSDEAIANVVSEVIEIDKIKKINVQSLEEE